MMVPVIEELTVTEAVRESVTVLDCVTVKVMEFVRLIVRLGERDRERDIVYVGLGL